MKKSEREKFINKFFRSFKLKGRGWCEEYPYNCFSCGKPDIANSVNKRTCFECRTVKARVRALKALVGGGVVGK